MTRPRIGTFLLVVLLAAPVAAASQEQQGQVIKPAVPPGYAYQQPFAYPSEGQDEAQVAKDTAECHAWAGEHMGFDPRSPYESVAAVAEQLDAAPEQGPVDGSGVRGAARGAAAGALIGWATGDAGKGAAIGAATGGVLGRVGSRRSRRAQQEQQAQAEADFETKQYEAFMFLVGKYDEAFTLCMGARDYAVNG